MFVKKILTLVLVLIPFVISGQGYVSPAHWSRYMIISPGFLGPNALPVPPMYNAINSQKTEIEFAFAGHFSKDDNTQNIFTRVYCPIAKGVVALDFYVVPLEAYQMTEEIIEKRILPSSKKKGIAGGDIYFSTIIQLLKGFEKLPDITFSMNCKTASGTNLENGRYTDGPGYWFDITMGKTIYESNGFLDDIRLSLMGGFYSWQTYRDNPQNDAILYGFRADTPIKGHNIYQTIGGLSGRFHNQRDDPFIYRFFIEKEKERSKYKFTFQQGLHNFDYTTLMISWTYLIENFDLINFGKEPL